MSEPATAHVVSNTSPIINLAFVGLLDLLPQLYGTILIPAAVWHEVVVQGSGQPGAVELQQASWIKIETPRNRDLVNTLRRELDAGEAEAIALALQIKADLLLMDERLGRDVAQYHKVRCVGLIGVLIEAKAKRRLPIIKPHLDTLREQAGFRISKSLYARVLSDVGEG